MVDSDILPICPLLYAGVKSVKFGLSSIVLLNQSNMYEI